MRKEYFEGIKEIKYEGPESNNLLAYHWYNAEEIVGGRKMKEHLPFAVSYWHTFGEVGLDSFGVPTRAYDWNRNDDVIGRARDKMDAAFEFITKMGLHYYCFHDVDLVDFGDDVEENERRLKEIVKYAERKQEESGVKLLWGTSNLFSHKKFMNGAATNPDFQVLTHAAAQVKNAIDATIRLGGQNYVFWGGREGYMSLLNTNMKREREHLAIFLHAAKDYGRRNGFKGTFLIEPKPCEPTKHQYDFDTATAIGFLREFDLIDDFKINIEANHAILAGHSFPHELQVAADTGMLGSVDANRGDHLNGWDTDQFPANINDVAEAMLVILKAGGIGEGGFNFDAKRRRNSTDSEDVFYAYISGIDTFARALKIAYSILEDGTYEAMRNQRYVTFDSGKGKAFEEGKLSLEDLRDLAISEGRPKQISGQQELYELLLNRFIK